MTRAAIVLVLAVLLPGCTSLRDAGIARYSIEPFFDPMTQAMQCCRATVTSGKDVALVHVQVTYSAGAVTVDLTERGVNGSSGQAVAAKAASDVAGAITQAASAAVTLSK